MHHGGGGYAVAHLADLYLVKMRLHDAPHFVDSKGLLEVHFDEGATLKVNAEVEPAEEQKRDPENQDNGRNAVEEFATSDNVKVKIKIQVRHPLRAERFGAGH